MPWNDHAGKFSALKAVVFLFTLYPAVWLVGRWAVGDLGARPFTEAIHRTGDWSVRFLVFALAVTTARAIFEFSRILLVRRMLGVAAGLYAVLHFVLYIFDQKWNLWTVASEVVLRFYLTVGFVALVGLSALCWTSTDWWQKRLGPVWKKLHRWAYPLTVLAMFHYALQAKINAKTAVFWFGLFIWLMLWRALPRRHHMRLGWLLAITPVATLVTAATEVTWYGLATTVSAQRVFEANLVFDPWARPASEVLVLGLVVVGLATLRQMQRHRHGRIKFLQRNEKSRRRRH